MQQLIAPRTARPDFVHSPIHPQQIHCRVPGTHLRGKFTHLKVGQRVVQDHGFGSFRFKMRHCLRSSPGLAHPPAHRRQLFTQASPEISIRARNHNRSRGGLVGGLRPALSIAPQTLQHKALCMSDLHYPSRLRRSISGAQAKEVKRAAPPEIRPAGLRPSPPSR